MAKDNTKITPSSPKSCSPDEVKKMLEKIETAMEKRENLHKKLPNGVHHCK